MGRVRCTFRDRHGKPVAGLVGQWFGTGQSWSPPSDAEGRSPWLPLMAGTWRVAVVPRRLLDEGARRRFAAAHLGEADPYRAVLVDLAAVEVVADGDRDVDVRVPDEWFQ